MRVSVEPAVYVSDLMTTAAASAAAVLCLRAGRRQRGAMRRFWWLLSAACAAWAVGEAIWGVYDLILQEEAPIPSWADVGYLSAIPLAAAGLLAHPAMRGGGTRTVRSLLDGLVAAAALLFISWTMVLEPLGKSIDYSTAGGLVALAYPVGDVVIAWFVILAVRGASDDRRSLFCLLGGLLTLGFADSAYTYLVGVQGFESGGWLDAAWIAGYLMIALGAWVARPGAVAVRASHSPSTSLAPILAPFIPVLAALIVIGAQTHLGHPPDRVGLFAAFGLIVLVLVRQVLVIVDVAAGMARPEPAR
jgi:hypothetical protein